MRKILVADDSRISRELLRDVLESEGREILEARNGREALDMVARDRPDLVLLDLEMPLVDGFTVLRELRRDPLSGGIPVVAVTAKVMQPEREKIMAAGFDAYISKPVCAAGLRKQVEELLQPRRRDEGGGDR
jgi:two-component system cell cycle response regulator DivK